MHMGGNQQFASPAEALIHISEAAWSNYTKADYTLEQWHNACLVHTHDGSPTSKSQCKLPVKTPEGTLNRNGVHAAAAALAGARGGLKGVSAEQKNKAAAALRRYYSQLEETAPESLAVHDALIHFGVPGMKWGVRKERARNLKSAVENKGTITRTTKNGDTFTVRPARTTQLNRSLAAISKNYAEAYAKGANLTIHDKDGKKIGSAMFDIKKNGDMYLNWVSIDKSSRGRGYASEVLKAAEEHGRSLGLKRMTLEVPGKAPDARHIYEKMGFTAGKSFGNKNDIWGGLTEMEKKLD